MHAASLGVSALLATGPAPQPPRDTRSVGADLLRDLFTGGGDGYVVNDLGVRLQGANRAEP